MISITYHHQTKCDNLGKNHTYSPYKYDTMLKGFLAYTTKTYSNEKQQ